MVTNLIDHDNLESRTPGSQDDNPKVTLPMVDVVHQLPPVTAPVERKTGGHHDASGAGCPKRPCRGWFWASSAWGSIW